MQKNERMKMINDVFAPKTGEKVLIFFDIPHDNVKDNDKWKESRQMAKRWYETFKEMGDSQGF
jgi:hypothetical protein